MKQPGPDSGPGFAIPRHIEFENNYFTEMCSGSEAGSYLRLTDFVYHSTLGLRVIKNIVRQRIPQCLFQTTYIHACIPPRRSLSSAFGLRVSLGAKALEPTKCGVVNPHSHRRMDMLVRPHSPRGWPPLQRVSRRTLPVLTDRRQSVNIHPEPPETISRPSS